MTQEGYERVLLVKQNVHVYKIPPLVSASRGFKAADWNLAEPDWTGRLRLVTKGDCLFLRIEDRNTGDLYCQAPVHTYPGPQVQKVVDSRRYFVVKVVSDKGRTALIGIGFAEGDDAFDLSVAMQDHFVSLNKTAQSPEEDRPKLDLSLKGDITVNLNFSGPGKRSTNRPKTQKSNSIDPSKPFLLPPPPSSKRR